MPMVCVLETKIIRIALRIVDLMRMVMEFQPLKIIVGRFQIQVIGGEPLVTVTLTSSKAIPSVVIP